MVDQVLSPPRPVSPHWNRYCSFLTLTAGGFTALQQVLLEEQLKEFARTPLARRLLGTHVPLSLEEFLFKVPFTTYADYAPDFDPRREDSLGDKPLFWAYTAGRGGTDKWIPTNERMYRSICRNVVSTLTLGSCQAPGQSSLTPGDVVFYSVAPRPYLTGYLALGVPEEFPLKLIPPPDLAEGMSFRERLERGFELAAACGLDEFMGLASVLTRMGEVYLRLTGRLPREVWQPKAIVAYGLDSSLYAPQIEHFWGRRPLEVHAASEVGVIATQTWSHQALTLLPEAAFYEFIPEDEMQKSKEHPYYQPRSVLADELAPGRRYELVLTNLHGGSLMRYRVGHLVRVTSLEDQAAGVRLPQLVYECRADDVIDLGGFTRLTERTICQAMVNADIPHRSWYAVKEFHEERPTLHLIVESSSSDQRSARAAIHEHLKRLDPFYADLELLLGMDPLRVTLVAPGQVRDRLTLSFSDEITLPRMQMPSSLVDRILAPAA